MCHQSSIQIYWICNIHIARDHGPQRYLTLLDIWDSGDNFLGLDVN